MKLSYWLFGRAPPRECSLFNYCQIVSRSSHELGVRCVCPASNGSPSIQPFFWKPNRVHKPLFLLESQAVRFLECINHIFCWRRCSTKPTINYFGRRPTNVVQHTTAAKHIFHRLGMHCYNESTRPGEARSRFDRTQFYSFRYWIINFAIRSD